MKKKTNEDMVLATATQAGSVWKETERTDLSRVCYRVVEDGLASCKARNLSK